MKFFRTSQSALERINQLPSPEREEMAELYCLLLRLRRLIWMGLAASILFAALLIIGLVRLPLMAFLFFGVLVVLFNRLTLFTLLGPHLLDVKRELKKKLEGDPGVKAYLLPLQQIAPHLRWVIRPYLKRPPTPF